MRTAFVSISPESHLSGGRKRCHYNCHLKEPGDQGDPRKQGDVGVGVHYGGAAVAILAVIVRASLD